VPVTPKTLFAIGRRRRHLPRFCSGCSSTRGCSTGISPSTGTYPGFRLYDEHASSHMTPRDLVTHPIRAYPGTDLAWYNNPMPRAELVTRLPFYRPNKDLRETFQYNNMMFLTAGHLAERLTGKTWEQASASGSSSHSA